MTTDVVTSTVRARVRLAAAMVAEQRHARRLAREYSTREQREAARLAIEDARLEQELARQELRKLTAFFPSAA